MSRVEGPPQGDQRTTRRERRALRRVEKTTRLAAERRVSRNRKIAAGVAGTVGTLLVIGAIALYQGRDPRAPTPTSPPVIVRTAAPELTKQDEQMLIQRAVEKRGIKLSEQEQELWQSFGPLPPIDDESAAPEFIRRFNETLNRMSQSENPYFQESAALLTSLLDNHDANVIFGRNVIVSGEPVAAVVNPVYLPNKIRWNIAISRNQLLRGNPLDPPLSLTHEARHINNQMAFINGLNPSRPMSEKFVLDQQRLNTPNTLLLEEMSGYTAQAEAHIHAFGLMGYDRALTRSGHDTITFGFLRSDENFDSPDWKNFILARYPNILKR